MLWQRVKNKSPNKYVSVEDFSKNFIQEATKDLGSSIALNMVEPGQAPKAKVLISHSWDEDIEVVIQMLRRAIGKTPLKGERGGFNNNTVVWFAAFALHQPKEGYTNPKNQGPSLEDQLKLGGSSVFTKVLESVQNMFVIQTSNCDPYSRLWCVSELFAAKPDDRVQIRHLFSRDWRETYVRTREGRDMLLTGHNTAISPSPKYYLLGEDALGRRHLVSESKPSSEPKLRINVTKVSLSFRQFSNSGPFFRLAITDNLDSCLIQELGKKSSNIKKFAEKERDRLDNLKPSTDPKEKYPYWMEMQNTIVKDLRDAANAPYAPVRTLSYKFASAVNVHGENIDIVNRVEEEGDDLKKLAIKKLGYMPTFIQYTADKPGAQPQRFLRFKPEEYVVDGEDKRGDKDAGIFFTEVMHLHADFAPKDKFLLSFGARDKNFGFEKIRDLGRKLNFTYIDSERLPPLAASYILEPPTDEPGAKMHPRNSFWMDYYQRAMKEAKLMAFVITEAWIESPNCWEELDWATGNQEFNRKDKPNIIIFQNQALAKELAKGCEKKFPSKRKPYSWTEMYNSFKTGTGKFHSVTAETSKEMEEEIKRFAILQGYRSTFGSATAGNLDEMVEE